MKTYEFSLVLTASEVTDGDCDHLYEAGCDDALIGTSNCVTRVMFSREADSLEEAIRSAVANVRSAGFDLTRIEMDPPV